MGIDKTNLVVAADNNCQSTGYLHFNRKAMRCMLGKNGIRSRKREGDGITPIGSYRILFGFYRADRIRKPKSKLSLVPIRRDFGWCDDPISPQYNRFITLPTNRRHEKLWRDDHLYDICLVLDYNFLPRIRSLGSAIFFHLEHKDKRPTEGCVAISYAHMCKILAQCDANPIMTIRP